VPECFQDEDVRGPQYTGAQGNFTTTAAAFGGGGFAEEVLVRFGEHIIDSVGSAEEARARDGQTKNYAGEFWIAK